MIMKRIILLFVFLQIFTSFIYGQDVIVKRDGSTIMSKVMEVNPDNLKYKKASNLDGPTYTILLKDVLSVNYENGEIDKFDSNILTSDQPDNNNTQIITSFINDGLISNYNDRDVTCNVEKSNKKANWIYRLLRVHNLSIIGNDDVKMQVSLSQNKNKGNTEVSLIVNIENTTDKSIYLDLANSSFRKVNQATSFFINSSTTTSSGNEGGGSINLGSIASILGVGGAVGTIASGTSVGGSKSSGTSTTIYADRVIMIPPKCNYQLPSKSFYKSLWNVSYKKDFKLGDRFKYKQPNKLVDSPWEIILSYVKEGDLDNPRKLDVGLFISEEISVKGSWDDCIKNVSDAAPIHYYYKVDD